MKKLFYDFHVHSCLSPCGDNDMTPNNIAGMAKINSIDIMALTDHNSSRNCPAYFKAASNYGIIPIAGMELTTAEDIHVVCLFEKLEDALMFNDEIDNHRPEIKNRPSIFGEQLVLDENDEIIDHEDNLLINASDISIEDVPEIVNKFGGICYPAHIDRDANGIIATLGTFPDSPKFSFVEFNDKANIEKYLSDYPALADKQILVSSDAHYLENMPEHEAFIELDIDDNDPDKIRAALFEYLRGGK